MADPQPKPKAVELLALLPASPDAYPQHLDLVRGLVLAIRMDEAAYRGASFLDDRVLGPGTQGAWLPGASVSEAAGRVAHPRPLHFIFHTGHVGSTLLSRLLDETGAVLPLREPLPLRVLADAHDALGRPESLLDAPQFEPSWIIGVVDAALPIRFLVADADLDFVLGEHRAKDTS